MLCRNPQSEVCPTFTALCKTNIPASEAMNANSSSHRGGDSCHFPEADLVSDLILHWSCVCCHNLFEFIYVTDLSSLGKFV